MTSDKQTLPNHEVKFSGASDDLVEIEGAVEDEVGASSPTVLQVKDPAGQRINVVFDYARRDTGYWAVGLQVVEENDSWPNWMTHWGSSRNGYSPMVVMSLPEGTTITQVYPEPEACDECERKHEPKSWTVGEK